MRRLAPALAFLALLAGCGDDDADSSHAPPTGVTELRIELDADGPGGRPVEVAEVSCGGEAEEPVCAAVGELPPDPAAPVPPDTACTEIYGGPDTLRVTGTLEGEPVDATLTRENGCEIERFDRFLPLLEELFPDYEPGASIAPG